jgi:hypothetical protein
VRFSVTLLTATLLTGSLVGCASGYGIPQTTSIAVDQSAQATASVLPVELRSSEILAKMHAGADRGADIATLGIYAFVQSGSTGFVYGYPFNDRSNGPPVCSVGPLNISYIATDIAVDSKGDLLVTETGTNTIKIFKGPGLCGPELGSIADPYGGYFQDVASRDGETIVAAYDYGPRRSNGVAVCTLSGGCTRHLHTAGWAFTRAVAIAANGDCWASGDDSGNIPGLAYFAHCRGNGVLATGFKNGQSGGLDIDANGNLVSISSAAPDDLYVYAGCNPACTLVGGPFQLKGSGDVDFGHLDGGANKFVAPDGHGNLDVYSYSPSGIHYLYSITNDTQGVSAAAFSPPSKE